jgi:major membrane immunogen (membrane-anchored lipoprotein)
MESAMSKPEFAAVVVAASLVLGACAREEKAEGVIPEGYKSAMEKAEAVEGKLEETLRARAPDTEESED